MNDKVLLGLRVLLGLFMLIFGLNKFLNFIPMPPIEGDGGTLMGIYFTSGFLNIIGILEIVFGLALLLGKYVPLALTILTAIMFNALLFHILHDPAGAGGAGVALVLCLALVYGYKDRFKSLLSM